MEGVLKSSVFKLNLEKFFTVEEMMGRNSFFVVSLFNWDCWFSKDNLFIIWVIRLNKGFSKGRTVCWKCPCLQVDIRFSGEFGDNLI